MPIFGDCNQKFCVYLCFVEPEDGRTEGAADVSLGGCRVMKEADL